jgi:aerobic-type carbon monoxide dehydrogenase small subunit (CoxS/CutS family)
MKRDITFGINGRQETLNVDDADTLLELLRDRFKLWSVRRGDVVAEGSTVCTPIISTCLNSD